MDLTNAFLDSNISSTSEFFRSIMNDDFMLIATLTFFMCEAVFSMLPIEKARSKQAASLVIGAVLGVVLIDGAPILDTLVQGMLAGGATTMLVAKFKKPSAPDAGTVAAPAPLVSAPISTLPTPDTIVDHL